MHLTNAAEAMVSELRDLVKWEIELSSDLTRTRGRLSELMASLDSLVRLLPLSDRVRLRLEIGKINLPLARKRRQASVMTDKVAAVHEMLATVDGTISVRQVQRELERRHLNSSSHDAHTILSRKAKQDMVRRVSRGIYRVNDQHPEILRRRARAQLATAANQPLED